MTYEPRNAAPGLSWQLLAGRAGQDYHPSPLATRRRSHNQTYCTPDTMLHTVLPCHSSVCSRVSALLITLPDTRS